MNKKIVARFRRRKKTRLRIKEQNIPKVTVTRSNRHITGQLIIPTEIGGFKVIAVSSSIGKKNSEIFQSIPKIEQAKKVGEILAKAIKKAGISKVAFDRSGYKYHGRVKAIAEELRADGIDC